MSKFNISYTERLLHKLYLCTQGLRASRNRKHLLHDDFTIISNNCWGGMTSEVYGLRKNSPTVGCYFFSDDYLKFIERLKYYTSLDLEFIDYKDSKHKDWIVDDSSRNAPIGRLDDIEIVFLHYKDKEMAREKWERRCKRINWNRLIFKYSYQNYATLDDLKKFDSLECGGAKIMMVNHPMPEFKSALYYPGFEDKKYLENDTFWGHRYFDVTRFLNTGIIVPLRKGWLRMLFGIS